MEKINCEVNNCSHNSSGVCYANRVNIGDNGCGSCDETCCGSFLNRKLYSDLTNNTNGGGKCDVLVCKASVCKYNKNQLCSLDQINVSGESVTIYTETYCSSFEKA